MVPVGTNIWGVAKETFLIFPQLGCVSLHSYSEATFKTVVIISRTSVVVSDILVVGATWYYISHTSSVRTQLVHDVWGARPNLTTVMFRDGTLYFVVISLLNIVDLLVNIIAFSGVAGTLDITDLALAMSNILISRFLICIREAAERSTQAFSSQSLSFIDSQGDSNPQPWLSSVEFAADIANPSVGDNSDADAFPGLEDDLDPRGQYDASEGRGDEIELEEYTVSVRSVDAHTP
ncbi:hypothetical protein IEO21_05422 [Rhodonia placenta]|uniref:Uncharacterized protein n=1 Tax=Rhodonia placenta TaxID=104341 RepID=A0A8H7U2A9_9APHY|nr:hypothetical protein IEO21_05422 [Postia placenta]